MNYLAINPTGPVHHGQLIEDYIPSERRNRECTVVFLQKKFWLLWIGVDWAKVAEDDWEPKFWRLYTLRSNRAMKMERKLKLTPRVDEWVKSEAKKRARIVMAQPAILWEDIRKGVGKHTEDYMTKEELMDEFNQLMDQTKAGKQLERSEK